MTNLDSMLKSRDITLPTQIRLVKAVAFPVVLYGCKRWTIKKAEWQRIDAFELWCWRVHSNTLSLESPRDCKEIQPVHSEGDQPWCSLEGMMLKLKLQYFGHFMLRVDSLEKTDAGEDWGQEKKGMTEDEMAGWHHGLDGCEFE